MERSQVAVVFGSFLFRSLSLVGFIRQFVHPGLCFGICPDRDDVVRCLHGEAFRQRLEDTIEKALTHAPIMPSIRRPGEPSAAAGSPPCATVLPHASVATELAMPGLEVDWTCVTWDADFRYGGNRREHWSFCGDRWNHIHKVDRQSYQKNAYRVLLTRARQGMVIVVPEGDRADLTLAAPSFTTPRSLICSGLGSRRFETRIGQPPVLSLPTMRNYWSLTAVR